MAYFGEHMKQRRTVTISIAVETDTTEQMDECLRALESYATEEVAVVVVDVIPAGVVVNSVVFADAVTQ